VGVAVSVYFASSTNIRSHSLCAQADNRRSSLWKLGLPTSAGVNAQALAAYMGHSSITVTLDRCGHAYLEGRRAPRCLPDARRSAETTLEALHVHASAHAKSASQRFGVQRPWPRVAVFANPGSRAWTTM